MCSKGIWATLTAQATSIEYTTTMNSENRTIDNHQAVAYTGHRPKRERCVAGHLGREVAATGPGLGESKARGGESKRDVCVRADGRK